MKPCKSTAQLEERIRAIAYKDEWDARLGEIASGVETAAFLREAVEGAEVGVMKTVADKSADLVRDAINARRFDIVTGLGKFFKTLKTPKRFKKTTVLVGEAVLHFVTFTGRLPTVEELTDYCKRHRVKLSLPAFKRARRELGIETLIKGQVEWLKE